MLGAAVRFYNLNPTAFDVVEALMSAFDDTDAHKVLSAADATGSTALMDSCRMTPPSAALLDRLLALPGVLATVNGSDVEGHTALMFGARHSFAEAVRRLSAGGADVEERDLAGHTALWHACDASAVPSMAALLSMDATIDAPTLWSCCLGFLMTNALLVMAACLALYYAVSLYPAMVGELRWRVLGRDEPISGDTSDSQTDSAAALRGSGRRSRRRTKGLAPASTPATSFAVPGVARRHPPRLIHDLARALQKPEVLFLPNIALFALGFSPAIMGTAISHLGPVLATVVAAAVSPCVDDDGAAQLQQQPRALLCVRATALLYVPFVHGVYHNMLLAPLQRLDGLGLLLGHTPLTLSSCIRCVISAHTALWLLLTLPIVLAGIYVSEPLRARFPPWTLYRTAVIAIGLNDLALLLCLVVYLRVTDAGGADPLSAHASMQLRTLFERTSVATVSLLSTAVIASAKYRRILSSWLTAHPWQLVQIAKESVVAAVNPGGREAPDRECVICLDGKATHILAPCGHMCVCAECAARLVDDTADCPICRARVVTVVAHVWTS